MPFVCPTINYFLANDELRLAKQGAAVCGKELALPHPAVLPPHLLPHGRGDVGVPRDKVGLWDPPASHPSQKGCPRGRGMAGLAGWAPLAVPAGGCCAGRALSASGGSPGALQERITG